MEWEQPRGDISKFPNGLLTTSSPCEAAHKEAAPSLTAAQLQVSLQLQVGCLPRSRSSHAFHCNLPSSPQGGDSPSSATTDSHVDCAVHVLGLSTSGCLDGIFWSVGGHRLSHCSLHPSTKVSAGPCAVLSASYRPAHSILKPPRRVQKHVPIIPHGHLGNHLNMAPRGLQVSLSL